MMILNASTAKDKFYSLITEANNTHEPIFVTANEGNVVLLSENDYNSMKETLYLSSMPNMKTKILDGLATPLNECVEDLSE